MTRFEAITEEALRELVGRFYASVRCDELLGPEAPGLVNPGEPHLAQPLGPVRMRFEFYREAPAIRPAPAARVLSSG